MHRREFLRNAIAVSGIALASSVLRSDRVGAKAIPRVVLDPGHGGWDAGGFGPDSNGTTCFEKNFTLPIALRAASLLQRDGCAVKLTRTNDTALSNDGVYPDLQARIDVANAFGADLFLSIHVNAFPDDPSVRGIATYYCSTRQFGSINQAFAQSVQTEVLGAMQQLGLEPPDMGFTDDGDLSGPGHLVVLGPANDHHPRATQMPGVLTELMFMTSPIEVDALQRDDVQTAFAHGVARAVEKQLGV